MLYITERCVFRLGESGLELIEIAPGVDLERDILAQMDFRPAVREPLPAMDPRIFRPQSMGLRDDLLRVPLEQRFVYDPQQNVLFVNLSHFTVKTLGGRRADPHGRRSTPLAVGQEGLCHRQL